MVRRTNNLSDRFALARWLAFAVLAGALVTSSATSSATGAEKGGAAVTYDVKPRRIGLIKPGTVIADKGPKGWSHIVIKSFPRVGAGDIKKVSATDVKLAGLLSTAFLANVKGERSADGQVHFRLSQAAVGLASQIGGHDTVVSPDTQKELGANFNFLARLVLSSMYKAQQKGTIVARSNTMALIDTPCVLRYQGVNRDMILRYALLVSPKTGRLDTLMWLIDINDKGVYQGVASKVQWLARDKVANVVLHVEADEYTLGVPSKRAFAAVQIPQGQKQIAVGKDVSAVLGMQRFAAKSAQTAENWLWGMLRQAAAGKKQ